MRATNLLLMAMAATLLVSVAPEPANAQFGINIRGLAGKAKQKARKKLNEIDKVAREGERALPNRYGKDPVKEASDLDKAEGLWEEAEGAMSTSYRKASNYKSVVQRLAKLRANIDHGWLQQACSAARAPIAASHDAGRLASEEELKGLDAAVLAMVAKVDSDDKALKFWSAEAKDVRVRNPEIAREAAKRAAKAAKEAKEKEIREAAAGLQDSYKGLKEVESKGLEAISGDMLTAFQTTIAGVKATTPEATGFFERRLQDFSAYNGWFAGEGAWSDAVAKGFSGANVASGSTKGEKMKLRFDGKADWCYMLTTRWRIHAGNESLQAYKWSRSGKNGMAAVQRFMGDTHGAGWMNKYGVCLTDKGKLDFKATLKFPGTRNGLDWVVVGWPREALPVQVATDIRLRRGDTCDFDAWSALWTNPVPGTLVYTEEGQPLLIQDGDGPKGSWLTAWTLSGRDKRITKDDVTSTAPAVRLIKASFGSARCPRLEYATHPDSIKLGKCSARIDKKYGALYDKHSKRRKNARTIGSYRSAGRALDGLDDKRRKEWKRSCGPTEKKLEKRGKATFDRTVDLLTDQAPPMRFDRATQLFNEHASF